MISIAVVRHRPPRSCRPVRTKGLLSRMLREPRGVIKLTLDFYGNPLDVLITHLDAFVLAEREAQAAHLVHRLVDPHRTTVMLGDMNAVPSALTRHRPFFSADRTHAIS
jgi:endonuclease/exonuclease/phosphatase family metal-dependent hydrolase